jgi:hypothetical protein
MDACVDSPMLRELDPFSFFAGHASALGGVGGGFGGDVSSPDPRYCLHTPYVDVAAGHARFYLRLSDVRASRGELALRVHAFREGIDAVVVASDMLALGELQAARLDHPVRFNVIEGFRYALFAYFNEPSDIVATGIRVELEELGERVAIRANLAEGVRGRESDVPLVPSPRLIDDEPFRDGDDAAVALEIVRGAGMLAAGVRGLLIDASDPELTAPLMDAGVEITVMGFALGEPVAVAADRWIDTVGAEGAFDFVICRSLTCGTVAASERLDVIGAGLRCLRGGVRRRSCCRSGCAVRMRGSAATRSSRSPCG